MNISRPTFQRILTKARKKLAGALFYGRAIKIEGGNVETPPKCQECNDEYKNRVSETSKYEIVSDKNDKIKLD